MHREYIKYKIIGLKQLIQDSGCTKESYINLISDKVLNDILIDMQNGIKVYRIFIVNKDGGNIDLVGGIGVDMDYYTSTNENFILSLIGEQYCIYIDKAELREFVLEDLLT